jgi:hypothetical protein
MSQLIKVIQGTEGRQRIYCDGKDHITMKDDKEINRWPCKCGQPIVKTVMENKGAENYETSGD